jgi:cysteine desulfurase/selenocysteine lyase
MTLAAYRAGFALDDGLHLNNAGVAPMGTLARDAMSAMADVQARQGTLGVMTLLERMEAARGRVATLVGARRENVSFLPSCAAAISQVALGFPFRPGDEIVTLDQEYPSNAYPWFVAAERSGARVVVVKSNADFSIDHDALIAAITPKTRVVAVSFVQFQTGAVVDLARVAEACRRVDAWLAVDAIQGIGVLPFDLARLGVDVVASGTHKWLCGPLGQGFLAFADGRRDMLAPVSIGAITYGTPDDAVDARRPVRSDPHRFEPGAPPVFAIAATDAAVAHTLSCGVDAIGDAARELAHRVVDGVRARRFEVLSAADLAMQSPIVTFRVGNHDAKAVHQALIRRRVACAHRGGGLRISPHAFCTPGDIMGFLAHLDDAIREASLA